MAEASSTLLFRPALNRARAIRRRELAVFLRTLSVAVAGGRNVTCLITNDAELRELNREFRGKDYPTDVLSFPAAPQEAENSLGELAIFQTCKGDAHHSVRTSAHGDAEGQAS